MPRKKNAAVEGEDYYAKTSDEKFVVPQPPNDDETEVTPQDGEDTTEEVIATPEEVISSGLKKIKLIMKGPIRGADGFKIAQHQTGEVISAVAESLVQNGQAEYV